MSNKKSKKDFPKGFSEYSPPYPPKKPEPIIQTYFEQEVFLSDSYGEIINVDDLISALLAFKTERPNTELHYKVKDFDPDYSYHSILFFFTGIKEKPNKEYKKQMKIFEPLQKKYEEDLVEWQKLKVEWDELQQSRTEAYELSQYKKLKKKFKGK